MSTTPPPHAPMAEKAILSLMMDDPDIFIRRANGEGIRSEMFHIYGTLFDAVCRHYKELGSFDLTVFVQSLALTGELDRMGGAAEITGVYTYSAGNAGTWTGLCAQLRETYAMRLAVTRSRRLCEAADSDELIRETEDALKAIREAVRGPKRAVSGKVAAREFVELQDEAQKAGSIPGASTGIECIDGISGGIRPGQFWVIGGKPSRGKSVLMLQIAAAFLTRQESVAVFTLEMMRHEIVGRLVSTIGRVDYGKIVQPRKMDSQLDLAHVKSAVKEIAESKLWIDDTPNQSVDSILNESIRLRDTNGSISLIVVDYLQLIRGNRGRGESREEEVARVSGSLKQLAKELSCPVISATQLNEAGQSRESRAIEQDADAAFYIVDDGIKVTKLRNGVRNDLLPLQLNGAFQRFSMTKIEN
jgi:replicative DNA helicase